MFYIYLLISLIHHQQLKSPSQHPSKTPLSTLYATTARFGSSNLSSLEHRLPRICSTRHSQHQGIEKSQIRLLKREMKFPERQDPTAQPDTKERGSKDLEGLRKIVSAVEDYGPTWSNCPSGVVEIYESTTQRSSVQSTSQSH